MIKTRTEHWTLIASDEKSCCLPTELMAIKVVFLAAVDASRYAMRERFKDYNSLTQRECNVSMFHMSDSMTL